MVISRRRRYDDEPAAISVFFGGNRVRRFVLSLCGVALAIPFVLQAQDKSTIKKVPAASSASFDSRPFSHLAFSAGLGFNGVNLQAATNLNQYMNLRAVGNVFKYDVKDITINDKNGARGVNVSGNLNFATAGATVDFYAAPRHSFVPRLSTGMLFYNQNGVSATGVLSAGNDMSLGDDKFYADTTNHPNDLPSVTAGIDLYKQKKAFTLTTGWGNIIPRKGGHWSFSNELGVAFSGSPQIRLGLSGYGCADINTTYNGVVYNDTYCNINLADENATAGAVPIGKIIHQDLNAQIAKYQKDVNVVKVFPIMSFGVSYSFGIR
jgi:hypothetical protein